jgi:predicted metal-dependent enzyme (double-stranded beta helix superfamily)
VFTIDAFVVDCQEAIAETQPTAAIKEVTERALSRPGDIDDALGVPTAWGFRTLHHGDDLTILQFIWPPGVELFPHDHRMWAVIGIYGGAEDNRFFRRTPDGIERSGGKSLEAGDVALLGAEAIHAVTNPRRTYTAALHVYGGDYFGTPRSQWDPETLREAPFDVEAVKRVLADADARAHEATGR